MTVYVEASDKSMIWNICQAYAEPGETIFATLQLVELPMS